jgi:ribosomal protein S18 acetylase RimI-like enzyme
MDKVTIRPAGAGDLDRFIAIMYDEPTPDMRGIMPDPRKGRAVGALILQAGLEVRPECTVVAELDGRVVGLMEAMRPSDDATIKPLAVLRVLARALPIVGPAGLLRYFRYQRARARVQVDRAPASFYIAELDVDPECRNRGIGGALLRYAEEVARREGFGLMSLTTTTINPAQHLYQRNGFHVVETRLDSAYEAITGIPGRVLMVKDLA